VKNNATARAVFVLCRVMVWTRASAKRGMAAIVGRDKKYHVCGSAHGFHDALELIRTNQPDVGM